MACRGKHRDRALELMDGLGLQATAWREGESIGAWPSIGYVQMAWAGFEIVAAWLTRTTHPHVLSRSSAFILGEYRALVRSRFWKTRRDRAEWSQRERRKPRRGPVAKKEVTRKQKWARPIKPSARPRR
jgi:hypothetical protein